MINAKPIEAPAAELSVPPYTLGAWLGDGDRRRPPRSPSADPEIVMRIEAEGLIARRSRSAKCRYQLLLPEARRLPRAHALCAVRRLSPHKPGPDVRPILRRARPVHVRSSTCAEMCGMRRALLRASTVPDVPQRRRNAAGALLRTLGVLGDKHIPLGYLRASEEQRRALLAGLLDTDGTVTTGGAIQFSVTNQRLARTWTSSS